MTDDIVRRAITQNGLRTHFLEAGAADAPVLVLLHEGAFGASAEASWAPLLPLLARHHRVIAPDLYGYGGSSRVVQFDASPYDLRLHQVGALLDLLGLGDRGAHFVGNSFGGGMALRAATTDWFSWRVRSAVSFGGTGGPFRTAEGLAHLGRFDGTEADMARLVRFANGDFDGFDEHVALRLAGADAGNYRSILGPMMEAPFAPAGAASDPYPENLGTVRVPIVAVTGEDDPFVEPVWAREITRHAPQGRALTIPGRHSPNVVDPLGTAQLIIDILRDNDAITASHAPLPRKEDS